jgi:hypothetical protein
MRKESELNSPLKIELTLLKHSNQPLSASLLISDPEEMPDINTRLLVLRSGSRQGHGPVFGFFLGKDYTSVELWNKKLFNGRCERRLIPLSVGARR